MSTDIISTKKEKKMHPKEDAFCLETRTIWGYRRVHVLAAITKYHLLPLLPPRTTPISSSTSTLGFFSSVVSPQPRVCILSWSFGFDHFAFVCTVITFGTRLIDSVVPTVDSCHRVSHKNLRNRFFRQEELAFTAIRRI